jgi:hypothetical protein
VADSPYLQVVRGDATPEEIAALVATLQAMAAALGDAASAGDRKRVVRPRHWNDPARLMRTPVHPSPGGWRRSAWG